MLRYLVIALALFAARDARAQNFRFETPAPAVSIPAVGRTEPIMLTRVAANIAAGSAWAEIASGIPCTRDELLKWREADNELATETFARVVRDELKAAGFATSGDPTNLFDRDSAKSDLQLGALISQLRVRSCSSVLLSEVWDTRILMDVEWQVYSVSEGKVVTRITTSGGFATKAKDPGLTEMLTGGFADNVRRLTQSESFRAVVAPRPQPQTVGQPAVASATPIRFNPARPTKTPLNSAVQSVVSIFAGESLGSGVLISSDGYILTNHHVAGAAGKVRIRWADGVETVGEVVRGDARRDVALIKTEPRAIALRIRPGEAQLGETVFAIGTPLDKQLAGTLTRGVVSANRQIAGQAWIQSDVSVTHGNSGGPLVDETGAVVGLTDWGIAPEGASVNINFFIPIADALRVLALTPAS